MKIEDFGTLIRARREQLGLSAALVAGELGFSVPYYYDVEHGKRAPFPPGDVYAKLASTLCLSRVTLELSAQHGRLPEGCPSSVAGIVATLLVHGDHMQSEEVEALETIVSRVRERREAADADDETRGQEVRG